MTGQHSGLLLTTPNEPRRAHAAFSEHWKTPTPPEGPEARSSGGGARAQSCERMRSEGDESDQMAFGERQGGVRVRRMLQRSQRGAEVLAARRAANLQQQ
eukprot:TRINITY_DN13894_c0_g1_i1.p2 TRINITY_DN13894_c0_g1~~TRINITY_DN13894_c0_g1_i1.p2  ORF type:complete len:100 (+),score=11.79 TRINITY_DN13894_c0_g1_i1:325-624(+)